MEVRLNDIELQEIAQLFTGEEKGEILYSKGGIEVVISYSATVRGYTESDYNNGTGAFIAEEVEVVIDDAYVSDCEVELYFDERKLIDMLERKLAA